MSELMIFLRNLCITLAVISIPLLLLWWIERYKLNKVKKSVKEIPQELRENVMAVCAEENDIGKQKIQYAVHNLGKGMALYVLFLIPGVFRLWGDWKEIPEYLMISSFVLLFILLFTVRDALRVAPWRKLRVVKAVECNVIVDPFHGDQYILYFDDKKQDFSVAKIEIGQKVRLDEDGCLRVVVAEKRKRICPIFVMEE